MKKVILLALLLAPLSLLAQKFGHFNTEDIINMMPEYTAAQNEIKALQQQYEADLKRMQDELQKKSEEYQKEEAKLLDNVKQRRQAELEDLYKRIQQSFQDNQQSLQKMSADKMQAITQKVLAVIKEVGQAGNYVYIMDISAGIPYVSTTLSTDVTADIKKKLNLK